MKKPVAGFILSAGFTYGRISAPAHNPWPPLARYFMSATVEVCASGQWVGAVSFKHEDKSVWYYPFIITATAVEASAVKFGFKRYPYANDDDSYLGQYHVGVIVDTYLDAVINTGWAAWKVAH